MSLTGLALSDRKGRLRPTMTRVTRPDGRVELERDGTTEETSDREAGFVIDTQPDLSLSQILPWLFLSSQDAAADTNLLRSGVPNKLYPLHCPASRLQEPQHIPHPQRSCWSGRDQGGRQLCREEDRAARCSRAGPKRR